MKTKSFTNSNKQQSRKKGPKSTFCACNIYEIVFIFHLNNSKFRKTNEHTSFGCFSARGVTATFIGMRHCLRRSWFAGMLYRLDRRKRGEELPWSSQKYSVVTSGGCSACGKPVGNKPLLASRSSFITWTCRNYKPDESNLK